MNNQLKRSKLFEEINQYCIEILIYKRGIKKPLAYEIHTMKNTWIKFFGFESLAEMTFEDLGNFKVLLKSKVDAEYKLKAFPIFHGKNT